MSSLRLGVEHADNQDTNLEILGHLGMDVPPPIARGADFKDQVGSDFGLTLRDCFLG